MAVLWWRQHQRRATQVSFGLVWLIGL
uniref:Uncharacterized protein n=1 Tax=Anguilla anguilla TaxID=7936 RepID=A0A0E9WFX5_ANGAN